MGWIDSLPVKDHAVRWLLFPCPSLCNLSPRLPCKAPGGDSRPPVPYGHGRGFSSELGQALLSGLLQLLGSVVPCPLSCFGSPVASSPLLSPNRSCARGFRRPQAFALGGDERSIAPEARRALEHLGKVHPCCALPVGWACRDGVEAFIGRRDGISTFTSVVCVRHPVAPHLLLSTRLMVGFPRFASPPLPPPRLPCSGKPTDSPGGD